VTQLENVADVYALSPTQQGMLFHTISAKDPGVYLVQMAVTLEGDIDTKRLFDTLQTVCSRHDALKSFYVWDGVDEPLQIVRKAVEFPVVELDWRAESLESQRLKLLQLVEKNKNDGIDITAAPLLNFWLCRCDENRYQLLFFFHHLILDGWSTQVLLTEILRQYDFQEDLDGPTFQFRNYVKWITERDVEGERDFWRSELADFSEANHLGSPQPFSRSAAMDHGQVNHFLTAAQTQGLVDLARRSQVTVSTVVRALWSLTVNRYSGGDSDIVFGTTVAGRPPELVGIESGIGSFINTIPFRTAIDSDKSLLLWLQEIQRNHGKTSQWEASSLFDIKKNANLESGSDFFDSILVFENYPQRQVDEASISIIETEHFEQSSYPLALLVVPGETMEFIFVFDKNRFPAVLIDRMKEQIDWLASQMVLGNQQKVGALCNLPESHRAIRNTDTDERCQPHFVDDFFSQNAAQRPDDIAVVFKGNEWTYGELDRKSNQIANFLVQSGVGPNVVVGICIDRCVEMLISIFGVLKAGGAYVPIDTSYPEEHIRFVVQDADAAVVLTTKEFSKALPEGLAKPVYIEQVLDSGDGKAKPEIDDLRTHDDLAYLIYTSGSTGLPKGVQITHANLAYSTWARSQHYTHSPRAFLLLSSFAFDSSVAGIFWTLSTGGTLVLPKPDQEKDVHALVSLIQNHAVSHLLCLPTLYQLILEASTGNQLSSLSTAIVAGESLPGRVVETHFAALPKAELHNEYGPTEATVWATAHQVNQEDAQTVVPIGKPIAGATISILDSQQRPVGWGAMGEICIAGPGVARGYLNQPKLTLKKFCESDDSHQETTRRMYRTGDMGYRLDDGSIVFSGRVDRQIKIRGHRIELGAVEAAMGRLDGVHEVYAAGWAPENQTAVKTLVAYAIAEGVSSSDLLRQLKQKLPAHMIPRRVYLVDHFSRLANGKVDLSLLPSPKSQELHETTIAPENETQTKLLEIWREVLGVSEICCANSRFFEIGGDSLSSIQLISKINSAFNKRLSPIHLIEAPTIRLLADLLHDSTAVVKSKILIRFNDLSKGTPLICVNSAALNAIHCRFLANRFSDRPVIALQSRGLDGEEEPLGSISDIAKDYLNEILETQEAPFQSGSFSCDLVGYCMGAPVALEMAKILEDRGCPARSLNIVDSGLKWPRPKSALARSRERHKHIFAWLPRYIWVRIAQYWFRLKQLAWRWKMKYSSNPEKLDHFWRWKAMQTIVAGHYTHESSEVQAPVLLVRSTESVADPNRSGHLDLERYAGGHFTVAVVDGDHDSALLEPMVEHVATAIREHVEKADAQDAAI